MESLRGRLRFKKRPDNLFKYDEAEKCYMTFEGIRVRTLYVSTLNTDISEHDLIHGFSAFGAVESVHIVKKSARAMQQFCYAFLTFSSAKETAELLKYRREFDIKGHIINYNLADPWHQPENPSGEEEFDKEVEVAQDPDESPIFKLDDDCLRSIFDLFPIQHRIKLGQVCKRWRYLNQLYWEGLTSLNFTAIPFSEIRLTHSKFDSILNLCPNLTKLKVKQEIYDSSSSYLISIGNHCKLLQNLVLINVIIHKKCLAYLARSCHDLREIYFDGVPTLFDHDIIDLLKNCTRLDTLKINYEKHLRGHFFHYLRPPLKTLQLSFFDCYNKIGYRGFLNVKETLTSLSIRLESLTSSQLTFITENFQNLEKFSIQGSFNMEAKELIKITQLKRLRSLFCSCELVEPEFIRQLAQQCPNLESLNLPGVQMQCMGKTLVELTSLKTLRLNGVFLYDEILILLSEKLKSLECVSLVCCSALTDVGVIELIINCPKLRKLDISGCENVTWKTVTIPLNFLKDSNRPQITIVARLSGVDKEYVSDLNLGNLIRLIF